MNIKIINPRNEENLEVTSNGLVDKEGNLFPLHNGAYRMVPLENYSGSFGYQWNKFQKTQIDKFSGRTLTKDRFFAATEWDNVDLKNQNVLEAGCGAGRFTQIALDHTNANLYSFDFSDSVTANFNNNGPNERLKLFQASIYEMPFAKNSFDKIFCFGVLQFTPDVKKSVACLVDVLKPGGELVIDYFPIRGWWTKINAKYILRPITKRISHERLMRLIERNVSWMIGLYNLFDKIKIGRITNRFIPICDIKYTLPHDLTKEELREWVILDTFNMLSPAFEYPQKEQQLVSWLNEFGGQEIRPSIKKYGANNSVQVIKCTK